MNEDRIYEIISKVTGIELEYLKLYYEVSSIRPSEVIEIVEKVIEELETCNHENIIETLTDHDLSKVADKWAKDLPSEQSIGIRTAFAAGYRIANLRDNNKTTDQ